MAHLYDEFIFYEWVIGSVHGLSPLDNLASIEDVGFVFEYQNSYEIFQEMNFEGSSNYRSFTLNLNVFKVQDDVLRVKNFSVPMLHEIISHAQSNLHIEKWRYVRISWRKY